MTASRIFLYFCVSFILGIFLNSLALIPQLLMLGFLILGILLISVLWSYKKIAVLGFCLLFLVLGIWRCQLAELKIMTDELRKFNDSGKDITLTGKVIKEPDIREKSTKLTFQTEQITIEKTSRQIEGRVLVTNWRYPEYQYGDKVKITGKLETPAVFEDFNYKDYLSKDGIYSVIYWPQIELVSKNQGNVVMAKVLEFKHKLREVIYRNLSPPQSSVLGAMVLGDKRQLSESLKEKLNIAGIRHITAVSGLHVAILTVILMALLIGFGLWRQQAFYLTCFLIFLFILMTGLQTSAVRAGIMGFLFLLSQHLGRQGISSRAVVFAAVLMLAFNPLLLRLDVGFQLSFLAVLGIIYLGPAFQEWLRKVPDRFLGFVSLRSILVMTFAAQVFTLPILIYNFGYFSLVSPLSNVLVVPLLPFIMGLGFLFAVLGIVWGPLGWVLSWPCWLLLIYLTKITYSVSGVSWASQSFGISWIWLFVFYSGLLLITWRLNRKYREPFFLR